MNHQQEAIRFIEQLIKPFVAVNTPKKRIK